MEDYPSGSDPTVEGTSRLYIYGKNQMTAFNLNHEPSVRFTQKNVSSTYVTLTAFDG